MGHFWRFSQNLPYFKSLWNFFSRVFGQNEFGSLHGIPWGAYIPIFSLLGVLCDHFLRAGLKRPPPLGIFHFKRPWGIGLSISVSRFFIISSIVAPLPISSSITCCFFFFGSVVWEVQVAVERAPRLGSCMGLLSSSRMPVTREGPAMWGLLWIS